MLRDVANHTTDHSTLLKFYNEAVTLPCVIAYNVHNGFGTSSGLNASPASTANCYDRDKQAWTVETDFERDYLRLKVRFH